MAQAKNVYLCIMFLRKKKNRSGSISVVAVSKSRGRYKEIRSFGTAETEEEISKLYAAAQHWLKTHGNQLPIDFDDERGLERDETIRVLDNMDAVLINGTQPLFDLPNLGVD